MTDRQLTQDEKDEILVRTLRDGILRARADLIEGKVTEEPKRNRLIQIWFDLYNWWLWKWGYGTPQISSHGREGDTILLFALGLILIYTLLR